MGAFICQISERDWQLSRRIGLYGNREMKPDGSGHLRVQDKMSVIRDIIAINPGDLVFFHVVKSTQGSESTIHGIYKTETPAYYDPTPVWQAPVTHREVYPYRFHFRPVASFPNLINRDIYVGVSELYELIENRRIWSLATLENERNMERRAVRKISIDDAKEIVKLILKQPKFASDLPIDYEFISAPQHPTYLEEKIERIATIENSIKAFLMYEIRRNSEIIQRLFGSVVDYMNETFVAQTTRKLFDVLIVARRNNLWDYYVLEAKTSNYGMKNLSQLLNYLDLLRRRKMPMVEESRILGIALAQRFSQDVKRAVSSFNALSIFDGIELVRYEPNSDTKSARFEKEICPTPQFDSSRTSEVCSTTDPEEYYSESNFEIVTTIQDSLKVKTVYLVVEDNHREFIKDFLILTIRRLTFLVLKRTLENLKNHIASKNYSYSDAQLILMSDEVENEAFEAIEHYNNVLKRPPIVILRRTQE